jgi:hypothetical protein
MRMGTSHNFCEKRPLCGEIGTEYGLPGYFIGAIYLPVSLPKLFEFNIVCISTKFSCHSNSRSNQAQSFAKKNPTTSRVLKTPAKNARSARHSTREKTLQDRF